MKLTIIKLLILFLIGIILYFLINVYNTFSIGAQKGWKMRDLMSATSTRTGIIPREGGGDDGDERDPNRWCKPSGGCGCFSRPNVKMNGVTLTPDSLNNLIEFLNDNWGDDHLTPLIRDLLNRALHNRELVFRTIAEFNDFFAPMRGTPDTNGNLQGGDAIAMGVFPAITPMEIHVRGNNFPGSTPPSSSGPKSPSSGKTVANQPTLPVQRGVGGNSVTTTDPRNAAKTFNAQSQPQPKPDSVTLPTANSQTVSKNTASRLTRSKQAKRALPDTATQKEKDNFNRLIMGEIETENQTGGNKRRGSNPEEWRITKKDTHKRSPTEWGRNDPNGSLVTPGTWSPINWGNNVLGRWDEWKNIHDDFGQPTFVNKGIHTTRGADGSVTMLEKARRATLGWQDWREQAAKPIKHALDTLGTQGLGKSGISKSLLDALHKLAQIPILNHNFVDPTATRVAFTPAGVRPIGTTGVGVEAQINPNLTFMQGLLSGFTGGLMVPQFDVGFPREEAGAVQQDAPQTHWANNTWVGNNLQNNFHQKDIQAVHDRLFDPSGIDFQRTHHEKAQEGPSMLRPRWGPQRCWLPLAWEPALADAKSRDDEANFREKDPKWGVKTLSRSRRWTTCDPTTGRPNGIHIESFRDVFHEKWHDLVRILRDFAKKYKINPFDENTNTTIGWTTAQRMMFLMIAAIIEFGILSDIPAMMNIIDNYSDVMKLLNAKVMGDVPNRGAFQNTDGTMGAAGLERYQRALRDRLGRDLLTYPNITQKCHHGVVGLTTQQGLRIGDPEATTEDIREDALMEDYIKEILAWAEKIRPILRYLLYTQIFRQQRNVGTEANIALADQLYAMWQAIEDARLASLTAAAANVCDVLPEAFKLYFKWGGKPPGPPSSGA